MVFVRIVRSVIYGLPLVFLLTCFIIPLAAILQRGLGSTSLATLLGDPYYRGVIWFSIWQALLSTLLTLALGLPAAYVFGRLHFRGRAVLHALATVPFVLPTVVVAAGFSALLGTGGWLGDLARAFGLPPPQVIGTLGLVVLAHVFYNYGLVVRVVGGLWAQLDPRLAQAAAVLGVGRLGVFWRITMPLLLPGIGAAALLVFIFTFGSFGVVLLLGGPQMATVEVEIYRQTTQRLNLEVAAGLAVVQALVTLMAGAAYRSLVTRMSGQAQLRGQVTMPRAPVRRERLLVAFVVAVTILLTLPLPALALRSFSLPPAPGQPAALTLRYYLSLAENPRGSLFFVPPAQAIANSVGFGLAALALALLTGLPAAYLAVGARTNPRQTERAERWARAGLDLLFTLPLGISAVMLGLGYLVMWGPLGWLRSPLLIPAAHALLAFPLVVRTLVPALLKQSPRVREAARMLGAGPGAVFVRIDLPLLAPSLLAAAVLAFTASLGEFGAALLLARPDFPTAPMVIARLLGQPGARNYGQALALSTLLLLASLVGFVLLERLQRTDPAEI
jgi:thiamine transport system permease protein